MQRGLGTWGYVCVVLLSVLMERTVRADPLIHVSCALNDHKLECGALLDESKGLTSATGFQMFEARVCLPATLRVRKDPVPEKLEPAFAVTATYAAGGTLYPIAIASTETTAAGNSQCWTVKPTQPLPRAIRSGDALAFSLVGEYQLQDKTAVTTSSATWTAPTTCHDAPDFNADTMDQIEGTPTAQEFCHALYWPMTDCDSAHPLPTQTGRFGGSSVRKDRLVLVYGPDGEMRGSPPSTTPEDVESYILIYRRRDSGDYTVALTNCNAPPVRVVGGTQTSGQNATTTPVTTHSPRAETNWAVSWIRVSRCSADAAVSVEIGVPEQPGYCSAATKKSQFRTEAVSNIAVYVAGVFNFGDYQTVGVERGVGGQPSRAFQRTDMVELRPVAGVIVFPAGVPTITGAPMFQRFGIGTAIDLSLPFRDLNLMGAVNLLPGLNLMLGMRFARFEKSLSGGVVPGAIFTGNDSDLPVVERWEWRPAFSIGVAIDQNLLRTITGVKF